MIVLEIQDSMKQSVEVFIIFSRNPDQLHMYDNKDTAIYLYKALSLIAVLTCIGLLDYLVTTYWIFS